VPTTSKKTDPDESIVQHIGVPSVEYFGMESGLLCAERWKAQCNQEEERSRLCHTQPPENICEDRLEESLPDSTSYHAPSGDRQAVIPITGWNSTGACAGCAEALESGAVASNATAITTLQALIDRSVLASIIAILL